MAESWFERFSFVPRALESPLEGPRQVSFLDRNSWNPVKPTSGEVTRLSDRHRRESRPLASSDRDERP